MKLNETAFAKAHAVLAFVAYILCVVAVAILPGSTKWLFDSWFHGLDLSSIPIQLGPASVIVVGITSLTLAAWVWGYFLAKTYNEFLK